MEAREERTFGNTVIVVWPFTVARHVPRKFNPSLELFFEQVALVEEEDDVDIREQLPTLSVSQYPGPME